MCAKSDVYVTWVRHNIVKPTKGKERLQVRVQCDDSDDGEDGCDVFIGDDLDDHEV